jgi:hypothetical protein
LLVAARLFKVYIKMAINETGCVVVDWIQLAQGRRNQWLVGWFMKILD